MYENLLSSQKFKTLHLKEQVELLTLLSPATKNKQILVDISNIVTHNINTGIQRVVKQQLHYLQNQDQIAYEIVPVYLKCIHNKYYFVYATKYIHRKHTAYTTEIPISITPNDILYSADLSYKSVQTAIDENIYKLYKVLGVKIVFLIHDILPITNPNYFKSNVKEEHTIWMKNITQISDLLISTTATGEQILKNWLNQKQFNIKTTYLHLGSNIQRGTIKPKEYKTKKHTLKKQISFLIVGTLEPRKGHLQLLKAFTSLLEENDNICLTIVGKVGWNIEETLHQIKTNPYINKNIFYKEVVSDDKLQQLYTQSDVLILSSNAEGFGLPIIEAAHYALPVIARDIPVFYEIAKENIHYFPDTQNPEDLAKSINKWILLKENSSHPKSEKIELLSWEMHTKKLYTLLR